jgi:hypothetical protein
MNDSIVSTIAQSEEELRIKIGQLMAAIDKYNQCVDTHFLGEYSPTCSGWMPLIKILTAFSLTVLGIYQVLGMIKPSHDSTRTEKCIESIMYTVVILYIGFFYPMIFAAIALVLCLLTVLGISFLCCLDFYDQFIRVT